MFRYHQPDKTCTGFHRRQKADNDESSADNRSVYNGLFILLLAVAFIFSSYSASFGSVTEKKQQLKAARVKLRGVRKNISLANQQEKDLSRQLSRTHWQLNKLKQDIGSINSGIRRSCGEIRKFRVELAAMRKKYNASQAVLQKRLKEIYLTEDVRMLNVLSGSSNLSEFTTQTDYLGRVVESDQKLINSVRMQQEAIRFKQRQLSDKYNKLLSWRGQLKLKKNSLEAIEGQRKQLLKDVEKKRDRYIQEKWDLEDHTHELETQIQDTIRNYYSGGSGSSGGGPRRSGSGNMAWPSSAPLTSDYGWRIHPVLGYSRFHTGIDLGACYGSTIKSTDSGTVIYSGWCGGYGNTVMIDHGRGVSTLYAHCSQIFVSNGQGVSKGQSVAAVGSTGMSTGPHLHFEVRVNGVPVSPWGYLK
ncbi:MAG: peptidoglycan DD-metalloendopeptidase family protein [Firmicutes bacterium]|nr:peptidoglycan DD-metalloendopeptidase family protein [Bacillota bacterium]